MVAKLDRSDIAEIWTYNSDPHESVVHVMHTVFLLLGTRVEFLKKTKLKTDYQNTWIAIKKFKKGLIKKITEFEATANILELKGFKAAEKRLNNIDIAEIQKVSKCAYVFYGWCKGVLKAVKELKELELVHEEDLKILENIKQNFSDTGEQKVSQVHVAAQNTRENVNYTEDSDSFLSDSDCFNEFDV